MNTYYSGIEGLLSIFTAAKLVPFKYKNEEKNGMSWKLWASEVGADCLSNSRWNQKKKKKDFVDQKHFRNLICFESFPQSSLI